MNPFQLINQFRQAQNPFMFMQKMAGNNPKAQEMVRNLQGMKPEDWEKYAVNMAKGMNTTPIDFLREKFPPEILQMIGIR